MNLDDAVIARLKKGGEDFEVLVDCEKAIDFKAGKGELEDVLASILIYKDSKKGMKANEHEMEKIFNTKDPKEVAAIIIKEGDIQLTTEYRSKLREEKRKRIIELIHINAVDSKTGLPHPITRLELAMDESKVNVDEFKKPEEQLESVLEKLREIIPIKFETKEIELNIPAQYAGASYSVIKSYGKVLKEDWGNDGSLSLKVEIPGGLTEEFFDKVNSLTHGEIESKINDKE